MPRLTHHTYITIHHQIKTRWDHGDRFTALPYEELVALHGFFAPSKDWSAEQLRAHRGTISRREESLPHKAGKAWAHLQQLDQAPAPRRRARRTRTARSSSLPSDVRLSVYGEQRVELDVEAIVRVIVEVATRLAEQEIARARHHAPNNDADRPAS